MRNYEIYTSLDVVPNHGCACHDVIYITRGATASLDFSLLNKVYTFEDIEQVTFLFKQGDYIYKYEMIDYNPNVNELGWTMDNHFSYDSTFSNINFVLTSEETLDLVETDDDLMEFEVVVKLDTDAILAQNIDSTIIEPQSPIAVVGSLYSKASRPNQGGGIRASSNLTCSDNLVCRN